MPDEYVLRQVTVAAGVTLAFDEWPARGPRVVFLHATGFSRGCWRPLAHRIAGRAQPTLVDMRGHGASSRPPAPYLWPSLVDDIAALITTENWSGIVLGGHSVGGATALQVAARLPERIAALVLVEAVIRRDSAPTGARSDLSTEAGAPVPPTSALTERTLRRRATWTSRAEAAEYLRARSPYDSWDGEVFASWIETGVTEQTGQFELSCPPWVEASVFAETGGSTAADDVERVRVPTWIARATGDRGLRSTCPDNLAAQIPGARETVVDGTGHFLPLEDVGLVERLVNEALDHVAATGPSAAMETTL